MKRSRRLLLSAALLGMLVLASAVPTWAQPTGQSPLGLRAAWQLDVLADSLDLTATQRDQVATILAHHREEGQVWMQSRREAARAERMAFHAAHRESLKVALSDVLTDDQEARLDVLLPQTPVGRAAMRSGRGGPQVGRGLTRGGQRGNGKFTRGGRADRPSMAGTRSLRWNGTALWERLDLSGEQRTQLSEMRAQHRAMVQEWLNANPNATRAERAAFFQEHWKNAQAALETVLTSEQVQELEALRSDRRDRAPRNVRPRGRM